MGNCKHDCERPPIFPKKIFNRPALSTIDYRIGSYSTMREYLLDQLNQSATLNAWTHRGADDPGIALLEGGAIVGDILSFYQSLYTNEIFLRTADWRESIAELVQLLGYRLAPGVGGEATFAVKVKGEEAVTIPKGFGFKADLEKAAAEFESNEAVTAYPHLSEFQLYRPADGPQAITAGTNQLELKAVAGREDFASLMAQEINEGDRLMLVPNSAMFDNNHVSYSKQDKAEILIVSHVKTILNRIIITFEGTLTVNRGNSVKAYVIGRSFRHFGHNAPPKLNMFDGTYVSQEDTEFWRNINVTNTGKDYFSTLSRYDMSLGQEVENLALGSKLINFDGIYASLEGTEFQHNINVTDTGNDYYSTLSRYDMPLDQEVDDLALGAKLICQGLGDLQDRTVTPYKKYSNVKFTVVKEIKDSRTDSLVWGNLSGASTVVTLMTNNQISIERTDIRQTSFHEVVSPTLTLRAATNFTDGVFDNGHLQYLGTYDEVRALAERKLLLVEKEKGIVQPVKVNSTLADFAIQLAEDNKDEDNVWLWDIKLDQEPEFRREDFDQVEPKITVYGNPVFATQGKTEQEVVLGSGDNREIFQTFVLPKTPLTYLLDESQTPAQVPELKIYVDGILWQRVDAFFNSRPDDHVYVIREDEEGNSHVQFGNGKTGGRLPSGYNNVVAIYRTGIGATGVLAAEKKPKGVGTLKPLEDVFLPGEVVGGGEAESGDCAREAAPQKMQSLGRLVGLADYEAEALALPGVLKVRADWAAPNGVPLVQIVVLTESGGPEVLGKVRSSINTYNRCRGPRRFPIDVIPGNYQYIYLKLSVAYASGYRQQDIEAAIKEALGVVGVEAEGDDNESGLFAMPQRRFGEGVHRSQILAAVQQVEGVTWAEVNGAQALGLGMPVETNPTQLAKPTVAMTIPRIDCQSTRILALHQSHFDLNLVLDETRTECEQ